MTISPLFDTKLFTSLIRNTCCLTNLSVKGVACETRRNAHFIFIISDHEKVEVLSELVNPISITNQ